MKLITLNSLIILCLISVNSFGQTKEEKGFQIMEQVEKSITGFGHYSVNMEMTLTNKGKSFERKIVTYCNEQNNDGERTLSVFKTPADVKEMKILMHTHLTEEDDQWLYIPALKATKRVANENKSGSFMGSEIAYEDMGTRLLYKFDFELLRTDEVNGITCDVVRCYPKSKYSGYNFKDVYVDRENMVPFYLEYFDKKDELLKVENIKFERYQNNSWLPVSMDMTNVKSERKTDVKWTDYKFNNEFSESFFLSTNMEFVQ